MNTTHPLALSKLPEVESLTKLRRSSIYARMNKNAKQYDSTFPTPINLSSSGRGSVAWVTAEVVAWVQLQVDKSRRQPVRW